MVPELVSRREIDASVRKHILPLLSASIVVPTVGITISELLLLFGFVHYSIWGHVLTLLVCTLAPIRYSDRAGIFLTFALLPVLRLVSLGMPVLLETTVYWLLLVYVPFLPALYVASLKVSEVRLSWGIGWGIGFSPLAVLIGIILAQIAFDILQPAAFTEGMNLWQTYRVALILLVVVLVEEMMFRGVLQRALFVHIGRWQGIMLASGLFGLMHAGYRSTDFVVFAAGFGLMLGILYEETDSLLLVTVLNWSWTVMLFGLIPLYGSVLLIEWSDLIVFFGG